MNIIRKEFTYLFCIMKKSIKNEGERKSFLADGGAGSAERLSCSNDCVCFFVSLSVGFGLLLHGFAF